MTYFRILSALVLMCAVSVVQAHSSGVSFNKIVGEYQVDLGFNAYALLSGEEEVTGDVLLYSPPPEESYDWDFVPFAEVRLVLRKDGAVLSDETVKGSNGLAPTRFAFREPGAYELTTRFTQSGAILVEAAFPFEVGNGGFSWGSFMSLLPYSVPLIVFLALGYYVVREAIRQRRQHAR